MFAHVDGWQWTPDLIWVDNLRSYGTPNYYVQKLFSNYKGTDAVAILMNNEEIAGKDSLYASAAIDRKSNEVIIKVVNASDKQKNTIFSIEGADKLANQGSLTLLKGESLQSVNSLENPTAVSPVTKPVQLKGKQLNIALEPYSFSVIRVSMK